VRAVANFARHFKQPPQELAAEHVRRYLLYLVQERRVSWSLYTRLRDLFISSARKASSRFSSSC
jgi:hypothetical protein